MFLLTDIENNKICFPSGTKIFLFYNRFDDPCLIYELPNKEIYFDTSFDVIDTCVDIPRKELRLYKGVRELHYLGDV